MDASNQLVSVHPDELRFQFELEKQTYCDLKVSNSTDGNVAFKVKTTSPKKYFVRPNTGVIHPGGSSVIRVTLQAQKEYPAEAVSKDKFLLQTTVVSSNTETDSLSADTFNKDSGRVIEESKLRVLYISSKLPHGEADSTKSVKRNTDEAQDSNTNDAQLELDSIINKLKMRVLTLVSFCSNNNLRSKASELGVKAFKGGHSRSCSAKAATPTGTGHLKKA